MHGNPGFSVSCQGGWGARALYFLQAQVQTGRNLRLWLVAVFVSLAPVGVPFMLGLGKDVIVSVVILNVSELQ